MEKSLFIPLREEGLTTMRIRYDFKTDAVRLYAAKEWEPDHDFAGYNHTWWIDGIYTEDARFLNTKEVWALFEKYGQKEDYFQEYHTLILLSFGCTLTSPCGCLPSLLCQFYRLLLQL